MSHSQFTKDGDQVTIGTSAGKECSITVFRINADDTRKRVKIASIPTKGLSYQHSLALTENYAIVFESPYRFDVKKMVMGHGIE